MMVSWSHPEFKIGELREYRGFVGSTLVGKVLSKNGIHSWQAEEWILEELGERREDDVAPLLVLDDVKRAVERCAEQWMVLKDYIELPINNVSESTSHLVDRIVDDLDGLGVEGLNQRAWNAIARRIEQMN